MSTSLQVRRTEQKVGLILHRVDTVRTRLNSLAWQRVIFRTLGRLVTAGALLMLAAFYLGPLTFLAVTIVLGVCLAAALALGLRRGWPTRVDNQRAASITDERADLKGRLQTIVEVQQSLKVIRSDFPPLWPYLVEDALAHADQFQPSKIERRRISRSIYNLIGSIALAALVFVLISVAPEPVPVMSTAGASASHNLELRPVRPDAEPDAGAEAEAQTAGQLEEDASASEGTAHGAPDKLLNRARRFAQNLQDRLTGRKEAAAKLNLKIADSSDSADLRRPESLPSEPDASKPASPGQRGEKTAPNPKTAPPAAEIAPPTVSKDSAPGGVPGPHSLSHDLASRPSGQSPPSGPDAHANSPLARGNGGPSRGDGVEPDTLFGPPSEAKAGNQRFEIAIEARPVTAGSKAEPQTYSVPKVHADLNANQRPDEPIARAAVPQEDREAIKRVFER